MHIFDMKFTRHCPKSRKFTAPDQKTTHHLQQLGDLLRVAGGVGSDAKAKAVDGRAKAMQLGDKRSRLIATPDCNSHVEADAVLGNRHWLSVSPRNHDA